ncbi:Dysfunctional dethiobiotin synthetase/adenosylmethionine-8-amino-7-oxononanoate aminotransferase [Trichophyton interdigitale]|uniref:Dysfunctional dethiobiotin synthetase/adenosylmethionine-8-amino-7-oxononanoate aminotransferase n=1 Tax=Trichophyton interdigitale TaxID=101480 RepID=A0A9P5CX57_9EURO|nr:Dysfunctional dethiobiotin synthetase/adenosylmethionine-8-amino-7-oxononanoate aminotransferase [Trichophyton interdigitale]KAF3899438.1 Dysfunctional dethiobiotin synthetase/adenosylmethionine-8-amino-7-oxononanoate aminotransferase [Trichophyton interdigitale]KAG8210871.1 Dysfunctional dethiobiotin synthetase/adenosylmethionine-8-amino-7-oxononanoate aminotransferase [Trichophyton interdigitale]
MLSSSTVAAGLWRSSRAYQVYAANTDIGKTVVSAVLFNAIPAYRPWASSKLRFLKPVSAGPAAEADDRHISRFTKGVTTACLYGYDRPVSPHLAARDLKIPHNDELLESIKSTLNYWDQDGASFALVESAGGVLSPGPSGLVQADLYRPLRLPVILIADHRLGGISASISAYESLCIRGYDVEGIVLFQDQYYQNHEYLKDFFGKKNVKVFSLPPPPSRKEKVDSETARLRDEEAMASFYEKTARHDEVFGLIDELSSKHTERLNRLDSMPAKAKEVIWYPFTQHNGMTPKDISVIDSAYGDCFQTLTRPESSTCEHVLRPTFDGSASWWTQGLGHGNPELALTSAYAAGRYGHVMFAGTIHEPALSLSEQLLKTSGNPRLQKVFFTDNGSTGMEVALKMGLRVSCTRYGWDASKEDIGIVGLKGSYHGDTIGVMDCSEPSTYNKKVEWYRGRGYWFDFPMVQMTDGIWKVSVPQGLRKELGDDVSFRNISSVFDLNARKESSIAGRYRNYIKKTLENVVQSGQKLGALIIEPIILGAGGMLFCDPLFQQSLVHVVRENPQIFSQYHHQPPASPDSWSGLPVIFDEVFTGLYRLGRRTAASFLDVDPDVSVHAKLLTGGLMPLCTTLASNEIFETFDSPHKSDALLHGHSYTANPVGCSVAMASLREMENMEHSGYWDEFVQDWKRTTTTPAGNNARSLTRPEVWSCWPQALVSDLSYADGVESVFAIGSVLSITLRDQHGGGYTSNAASGLQKKLMAGEGSFNIHSRVLGNVLYLMASVTSTREVLSKVETLLRKSLVDENRECGVQEEVAVQYATLRC